MYVHILGSIRCMCGAGTVRVCADAVQARTDAVLAWEHP